MVKKINYFKAQVYYNKGLLKYDKENYKGALRDYDKAIKINPKYMLAYNNRGKPRKNWGI